MIPFNPDNKPESIFPTTEVARLKNLPKVIELQMADKEFKPGLNCKSQHSSLHTMLLQSYCGPSSLQPFYYYCLNPHICGVLFYKHTRLLKTQSLAPALKKEATSKSQNDQKYWIIHLRVIRISPHYIKPEGKKLYLHLRTRIPN